jgi:penicillin amidase
MNRARDCLELREALRLWAAPQQNIVYADSKGNIGYTFAGQIPIRAKGDGRLPVPGWTGEYEWIGHIPFDELPHSYNPPQGYIATANNRPVDEGYPYFLMSDCSMGDRAQRIVELLEARPTADAGYFKTMHFDQVSPLARDLKRYLGQLHIDDPELASIVERMRAWDGTLGVDSPEAAIYQVFIRRMIRTCLSDRLGELMERYAGQGPTPLIQEGTTFAEKSWAWLRETLAQPDSPRFDLGGGEDRDEVMRRALTESIQYLKDRFRPNPDDWSWGQLHRLAYSHPLGRVRPLDRLLNRGPFPMGGDQSTVWATGHRSFGDTPSSVIGPPFRFIADLGDPSNSWGLLAPGQSGQPGSKHYDDQIQAWFDGGYHPMLYHRDDVEREAQARLRLLP